MMEGKVKVEYSAVFTRIACVWSRIEAAGRPTKNRVVQSGQPSEVN